MSITRKDYEMITLANGKRVSILDLLDKRGPDAEIVLLNPATNKRVNVRIGDIPLFVFELKCKCQNKGIAVSKGDVIFCDKHQSLQKVTRIIS